MDITKIAYEKYRLDWMLRHGYTLDDLMDCLLEEQEQDFRAHVSVLFTRWEENGNGFDGSLWACYDEFMESEFLDTAYMTNLLNTEECYAYHKWIAAHPEAWEDIQSRWKHKEESMLIHEKKNAETLMRLVVCHANISNCEKCPQRNDCIRQNPSFITDIIDLIKWKDAEIEARKWTNRRLITTEKERRRELWKKAVQTTAEEIKKKSRIVIGTPTERNILGFEFIINDAGFTDIINDLLKEKKRRNT